MATDERYLDDDVLFEHAAMLLEGLCVLRAEQLETSPALLCVVDAAAPGRVGGTLASFERWSRYVGTPEVIELQPLRRAVASDSGTAGVTAAPAAMSAGPRVLFGDSPGWRPQRSLKTMLFADFAGYSRLHDEFAPLFRQRFLEIGARQIEAAQVKPLEAKTWGDALYIVFDAPRDGAEFALRLLASMQAVDWRATGLPQESQIRVALQAGPVFRSFDPVMGREVEPSANGGKAERGWPCGLAAGVANGRSWVGLQNSRHKSTVALSFSDSDPYGGRMARSTILRARGPNAQPDPGAKGFCLNASLIRAVLDHARPLGHHEAPETLNLGFGFLYYALARALRPKHVVVIGSGFGFSVVCLALGLKDNGAGQLSFVDPSYSVLTDGPFKTVGGTSQWDEPEKVTRHFARFGVEGFLTHYRLRSDEFFARYPASGLPEIDLAFIDGSHAYPDVRQDFVSTVRHAHKNTYLLLHDTNIYVRELVRHAGVKRWLKEVKREKELFEIVDFPFSSGVAIVRVLENDAWRFLDSVKSP